MQTGELNFLSSVFPDLFLLPKWLSAGTVIYYSASLMCFTVTFELPLSDNGGT